jgi:uncharacterized membrane protein
MSNPIKPNFKTEIWPVMFLVIAVLSSFYFYTNFPEKVPMHWNVAGEVDGWGSRVQGAFMIPALLIGMYFLFLLIPYLDPKKERYAQFVKVYHIFKTFIIFFLLAIYLVASLNGLGHRIPVGLWTPVLVGLLFIIIGNYMGKIKMNWFMGIRTPWTLSSESVWNKTHRFGGKVFIISGLAMMLMQALPVWLRLPLFIAIMVFILTGTVLYSYIIFKKENRKYDGPNNQPGKSAN